MSGLGVGHVRPSSLKPGLGTQVKGGEAGHVRAGGWTCLRKLSETQIRGRIRPAGT
jgi:hypothetical protein